MPHTMALVCFLKRVVALAAQRQQTRVRAQHTNIDIDILKTKHTQARGGGRGAGGAIRDTAGALRGKKLTMTQQGRGRK